MKKMHFKSRQIFILTFFKNLQPLRKKEKGKENGERAIVVQLKTMVKNNA